MSTEFQHDVRGVLGGDQEIGEGVCLLERAARTNYVVAAMSASARYGFKGSFPGFYSLHLHSLWYLACEKAHVQARGKNSTASIFLLKPVSESEQGMLLPELLTKGDTLVIVDSCMYASSLSAVSRVLSVHLSL